MFARVLVLVAPLLFPAFLSLAVLDAGFSAPRAVLDALRLSPTPAAAAQRAMVGASEEDAAPCHDPVEAAAQHAV